MSIIIISILVVNTLVLFKMYNKITGEQQSIRNLLGEFAADPLLWAHKTRSK